MNDFIGYSGRINRLRFLTIWLFYFFCFLTAGFVIKYLAAATNQTNTLLESVFLLGSYLTFTVFASFIEVKRFHDTGRSGWYYFLALIPLLNLYFGIYLLFFKRGEDGPNQFGNDPSGPAEGLDFTPSQIGALSN